MTFFQKESVDCRMNTKASVCQERSSKKQCPGFHVKTERARPTAASRRRTAPPDPRFASLLHGALLNYAWPKMSSSMICSANRCRTLSTEQTLRTSTATPTAAAPLHPPRPSCVGKVDLAVSFCTRWRPQGRASAQPVGRPTRAGQVLVSTTANNHRTVSVCVCIQA